MVKKTKSKTLQTAGANGSMFEDSAVMEVTDKDFKFNGNGNNSVDEIVVLKKQKPAYMMVYSSSCPHCQNKRPMYIELAEHLNKGKSPEVLVLAINVQDDQTQQLQEKLGISGVPSFFETDETGRVKRLDNALEVLGQSLKMSPAEVRQRMVEPTEYGELDEPERFEELDESRFDEPDRFGEAPGLELLQQGRRSIPLEMPADFPEQIGRGCGDDDRHQVEDYLNELSIKDLRSLAKEFKGTVKGRQKAEIVKYLLN